MHSIAFWPIVIVLAIATVTDLRERRIPNWLVLPCLVVGVVVSGFHGGWHGFGQSCAGLGLGFLLYGAIFLMGGMGMGDVKLCAALGAWIGPHQLMLALVVTGIAGGIMAVCWAAADGFLADLFRNTGDLIFCIWKRGLHRHPELALDNPKARKMPYAPAIAIGTLLSFFAH